MNVLIGIIFFLSIVLESTFVQLPLALVFLLIIFVKRKTTGVFEAAFIIGIILDIFIMRRVGLTSLFFTVFIFLVSLYDRKYEIHTFIFVVVSSFIGAFTYFLIFERQILLWPTFMTAIIGGSIFVLLKSKILNFNLKK